MSEQAVKETPKTGAYTVEAKDAAWQLYVELLSVYMDRPKGVGECMPTIVLLQLEGLFRVRTEVFRNAGGKSIRTFQKFLPFIEDEIRPFVHKWQTEVADGSFRTEHLMEVKGPIFYVEMEPLYEKIKEMCGALARIAQVEDLT